jgi:GT2 family glycosyltransferase
MPRVTVIIPTQLVRPDLLAECLRALKESSYRDFECLVVVNGGEAELEAAVREIQQALQTNRLEPSWLFLGSNRGFTGAVNAGFSESDSELVALLNDDAVPDPNWLAELVKTHDTTGASMIASTIYRTDPAQTLDSQGFSFAWRGKAEALTEGTPSFADDQDYWLKQPALLPENASLQEPFGPDAAACLYTRALLKTLDGFNPDFFAYLEDVELALRARMLGETCVVASHAVVHHHKHATSSKRSSFKERQDLLNWLRICTTVYPRAAWQQFGLQIVLERGRNLSGLLKQWFRGV